MKLTKTQKAKWLEDASQLFGSRIWGNPFRPNVKYKFTGFSDTVNTKTVTRGGKPTEITERFVIVSDSIKEFEVNTKFFFTTYNESEELSSPTVYGLGDGVTDPVQILFEAVEALKEFTIEYITAYSLDFAHWEKTKERKLAANEKAIRYIIK